MVPKEVGSTWLHVYRGQLWPVVLCDNDTPSQTFMKSKPSGYVSPAILLGKVIYIWVADIRLREFEPSKDYLKGLVPFKSDHILDSDSDDDKLEKVRRKAFMVDAMQFESPAFWMNFIEQRSKARAAQKAIVAKRKRAPNDIEAKNSSMRRSSTSSYQFKKPKSLDACVPQDEGYLPTPGPTPMKDKPTNGTGGPGFDTDSDEDTLFIRTKKYRDPFTDNTGVGEEDASHERRLRNERDNKKRKLRTHPPGDEFCTILIGETKIPFLVLKDEVGRCDFLTDRVAFTKDLRTHIDLSNESNIEAKDFIPIAEYLRMGEFAPRLIHSGASHCLEDVVLSEEMDDAALQISKICLTASRIQLEALQLLCLDKLKTLHSLSPERVVIVVTLFLKRQRHDRDSKAEKETWQWMVDLLAEHFWALVSYTGITFTRIMSDDEQLRHSVLEAMSSNPAIGEAGLE